MLVHFGLCSGQLQRRHGVVASITVALFIATDVMEGDPSEDTFVPPKDADPAKEAAAAVGGAEDTQAAAKSSRSS